MKLLNLCVAVIFSLSLCLATAPVATFAKDTKEVETSKTKAKTSSKSSSSASKSTSKSDKSSSSSKSTASSSKKAASAPVNINTASKEELQTLPGVGPTIADAIMKYRKANGKFKSANDLLGVKGIGEKTLKTMKPLLKF